MWFLRIIYDFKENYQLEMLEGAKRIGAGAATIASAGAATNHIWFVRIICDL